MRFFEFSNSINEVNMSPGNLAKSAKEVNAVCGIEFEMYVPFDVSDHDEIEDRMSELANSIEMYTSRDAIYSLDSHGEDHAKGTMYVIEPDGSLKSKKPGYEGLEIVSPAIPFSEMLSEINIIQDWANDNNCYANASTGLHMNISIEGVDMGDIDYVKLILFTGDQHVLKQFDREANIYCSSSLKELSTAVHSDQSAAYAIMQGLQSNLAASANSLYDQNYSRRVSINRKINCIEFRSPGGDWINNIDQMLNALNRFVVAVSIAADPNAHRQEYAKKLYKLVMSNGTPANSVELFTMFQSGQLTTNDLKRKVKVGKAERPAAYSPAQLRAGNRSWVVEMPNGKKIVVTAETAKAAVAKIRTQYKLNSVQYPDKMFNIQPNIQRDMYGTSFAHPPVNQEVDWSKYSQKATNPKQQTIPGMNKTDDDWETALSKFDNMFK